MAASLVEDGTPKTTTELVEQLKRLPESELDEEAIYWRVREYAANKFAVAFATVDAQNLALLDSVWNKFSERDTTFLLTMRYLIGTKSMLAEGKIVAHFITILVAFGLARELKPEETNVLSYIERLLFPDKTQYDCTKHGEPL